MAVTGETEGVMKVLVVGAGAVGQTFGFHLQRGGAQVDVLVKPKYAEEARRGYTLYDLRKGGTAEPLPFVPDGVCTGAGEVADERYDVVLITVSSAAMASGTWLEELVEAAPEATIAGMQPGLGDWDRVRELAGAERVIWGVIELIAYQSPLPGATGPEGVAYWIPWWLMFPFSGPSARVAPLVDAFRAGRLRSREVADVTALTAVGAPALNLHMAALEASGWRIDRLVADRELLTLTSEAVREASAAAGHQQGVAVPLWVRWMRPWHLRVLAWVARRTIPLDLETYLRFHFTKVGEQTRMSLDRWIAAADEAGLPSQAMREVRRRRAASERTAA